jgi:hypothetical protein
LAFPLFVFKKFFRQLGYNQFILNQSSIYMHICYVQPFTFSPQLLVKLKGFRLTSLRSRGGDKRRFYDFANIKERGGVANC